MTDFVQETDFVQDQLNIGLFKPIDTVKKTDFNIFSEIFETVVKTEIEAEDNNEFVYDDDRNSSITLLNWTSKSGFVYKLNAPNLKYQKLNGQTVTQLIMKIAPISKEPLSYYFSNVFNFGKLEPFFKQTMTKRSVINEAKIQQHIWLESIKTGIPICPCVGNFLLIKKEFLKNPENQVLMNFINKLLFYDLKRLIKDDMNILPIQGVSIFLMENIDGYVFDSSMINLFPKVIATIIRLFFIGILHLDLIEPNILVTHYGVIKLIDFEYASNIRNIGDSNDIFFDDTKKLDIDRKRKQFLLDFNNLKQKSRRKRKIDEIDVDEIDEVKITLMTSIMDYIYEITNQKRRHLEWYDKNSINFIVVFQQLNEMHTPILTPEQIKECEDRCFKKFSEMPQIEKNCIMCGGNKRIYKKNTKKYKNNKIKKKSRILSKKIM